VTKYPTSLPKNLQIGFDAAQPLPPLSLDDDEPLLPPGLRVNMLCIQGNLREVSSIVICVDRILGYRGSRPVAVCVPYLLKKVIGRSIVLDSSGELSPPMI